MAFISELIVRYNNIKPDILVPKRPYYILFNNDDDDNDFS